MFLLIYYPKTMLAIKLLLISSGMQLMFMHLIRCFVMVSDKFFYHAFEIIIPFFQLLNIAAY